MKPKILYILGLVLLLLAFFALGISLLSARYGEHLKIIIEKDETFSELSRELKYNHIISSELLFKVFMRAMGSDKKIVPGEYLFSKNTPLTIISHRLAIGDYQLPLKQILIPEGSTSKDIAQILGDTYPNFDQDLFTAKARSFEGYLFPDTYEAFISTSTDDIILALTTNFGVRTKKLQEEAVKENKKWKEIVIMASLLEEEGKTLGERKVISGILWKRLEKGINLQVDSTFRYINGKTTKELSLDDLKIDSPYNTYLNPGLPVGPISNPGVESLEAALHPTFSDYLYFLTGDDGITHYSRTFEEHVANKEKYLK